MISDEDEVRHQRSEWIGQVDGAERLGDADNQPAEQDADKIRHAAEHHDEQRDHGIAQPLRRLDRRARQQQRRSQRQDANAERERHYLDAADIDPHQGCSMGEFWCTARIERPKSVDRSMTKRPIARCDRDAERDDVRHPQYDLAKNQ